MNTNFDIAALGSQARAAAQVMSGLSGKEKNFALQKIAQSIESNRANILQANKLDLQSAAYKLDAAMLDRLTLTDATIESMVESLEQVIQLADPVGSITNLVEQSSGIKVGKMSVPLGVIGMIYESRPNVTLEAASLCIKSGNAVVLRGGSEALQSNMAIYAAIEAGLQQSQIPVTAVQLIKTADRSVVHELATAQNCLDIIIPRGGKSLIQALIDVAKVPVIKHLEGICHVYLDKDADMNMASNIAINAKTQRFGVCNAMETLLLHKDIADALLPSLADEYLAKGVELRVCERTHQMLSDTQICTIATDDDWSSEYLAPILSIKIVDSIDKAIEHINTYGSGHTDAIVTSSDDRANQFLRQVDSSSVMHNTSTRFADGFAYGLGAEIGISTDKLHVRGPVGLKGLTSEKYVVISDGAIKQ